MITNAVSEPFNGNDWFTVKESVEDSVNLQIDEINQKISELEN